MAEPAEIAALLQTIDQSADALHVDITPSVLKLIELQLAGAIAVCDLLNSEQHLTRKRAQRVLEGAVFLHFGFRCGQGFPYSESERKAHQVIAENGYEAEAPEPQRRKAIERWRQWLHHEMKGRRDE